MVADFSGSRSASSVFQLFEIGDHSLESHEGHLLAARQQQGFGGVSTVLALFDAGVHVICSHD